MTHDELLAKIDEALGEGSYTFTISKLSELLAQGKALRAVVERHHPDEYGKCSECLDAPLADMADYPCQTIKDIQEQLK